MPDYPLNMPEVNLSAIAAARDVGYDIAQTDGVWCLRDVNDSRVAAARLFLRSYDPMAMERGLAIARVKEEGDRRINELIPQAEQIMLISSGLSLIDKRLSGQTWNAEDEAEVAIARAAWNKARLIRRAQRRIVQFEIRPLDNTNAIQAFDPTLSIRWPTAEEINAPDNVAGDARCMVDPIIMTMA